MNILNVQLPERWESTTLGVVCKRGGGLIQTGPFGSQLHASDYIPFGVPSIMPVNIGDNQIVTQGIARISEIDAERLSRYRVRQGDIVYSRRGDVERCSLIREEQNGWLCGTGCLMIRLGEGVIDPRFASFYLKYPAVKEWILRHALGATMPNLNTSIMQAVPVVLPPLPTQHAIARILGSLDDKIELNRQMNETLEAMARAIFQSWFVDFDPVRAKAEGRQPAGMDAETAALFPSEMVEVDGREVPKGWGIGAIGEATTIVGGSTPSTTNPSYWDNGTHPFATPKDLAGLSTPILFDTEKKITESGVDQISSRILPTGTVLLSSRAPIGYIALTTIPVSINQGFIAIICDKALPNYYMMSWVKENLPLIIDRANGTTFLEISKSNFKPMEILLPPQGILMKFVEQVGPLYAMMENNEQQSRMLGEIRDALLPKLMSGEIQVDEMNGMVT